MAGAIRRTLAGVTGRVWQVEQRVSARFNRWCRDGVRERLFKVLSHDRDFEYVLVDSTIVRAHQHSAGAQKKPVDPKKGLKLTHWGGQKVA